MARKKKKLVKLQCAECKKVNYYTYKNPVSMEKKMELKKFCKGCKKHTAHKETKR